MTIIERQYLSTSAVQDLCIAQGLYTQGDNADYAALLGSIQTLSSTGRIGSQDIYNIATDILRHSRTSMDKADIMYLIASKVCRSFKVFECSGK